MTADARPFDVWRQRLLDRATDFCLTYDDASVTLDSAEQLHDLFYHPRPFWQAVPGYADPAMDVLIEKIDGEVSSPIRDALIEQAWRKVLDEVVVIPLYHPVTVWAMREGLAVPLHALGWPLFRQVRWTGPR